MSTQPPSSQVFKMTVAFIRDFPSGENLVTYAQKIVNRQKSAGRYPLARFVALKVLLEKVSRRRQRQSYKEQLKEISSDHPEIEEGWSDEFLKRKMVV